MADAIDRNIAAFEKVRADLEKSSMDKWVLFHDEKHIGTFDTFEEAAEVATEKFGSGPYLIRQVGASDITLPVSVSLMR